MTVVGGLGCHTKEQRDARAHLIGVGSHQGQAYEAVRVTSSHHTTYEVLSGFAIQPVGKRESGSPAQAPTLYVLDARLQIT